MYNLQPFFTGDRTSFVCAWPKTNVTQGSNKGTVLIELSRVTLRTAPLRGSKKGTLLVYANGVDWTIPCHIENYSSAGIKEKYIDFGINTPNMSMQNHSVPELPNKLSKHLSYTTALNKLNGYLAITYYLAAYIAILKKIAT